jgi:hypothetical protein
MYVRYKLPQRFEKVEDSTFHSRMKTHVLKEGKFLNMEFLDSSF